jgi:predicted Zn-dependent peptidase
MNERFAPPAGSYSVNVSKIESPRGIRAWLVEDYAVPLVSVEFAFRGGASQDPEGRYGAATIFSGFIARSTRRRSNSVSMPTRTRSPAACGRCSATSTAPVSCSRSL